ncbi:hypothetical protein IL306_004434 [Fusarium sp. DS 682]|nr:hypothetical protein IL306_004434 [Fusarium sp. DS 682]
MVARELGTFLDAFEMSGPVFMPDLKTTGCIAHSFIMIAEVKAAEPVGTNTGVARETLAPEPPASTDRSGTMKPLKKRLKALVTQPDRKPKITPTCRKLKLTS